MKEESINLYQLNFDKAKTYLYAGAFVIGNIALPQLCHLMPQGGLIFLPIYFFTLIAAYKYGWKVGLLTGLLSALSNHLLFGMPAASVLPFILIKSSLLALIAGTVAHHYNKVSLVLLLAVVLGYQLLGTALEWAILGDLQLALQDFRIGFPGMILQIVGGFVVLRYLLRK